MNEAQAMARAIELGWRGWGHVHPNPMVGSVLLAGNEVVGEGFHAEFGGVHAEVAALGAAGRRAAGATAVVTLEPCTHVGKQPPCADALIRAGVRRVVAAVRDPNPAAAGGARRMRDAGIDVEIGLLGGQAAAQNAAFFHYLRNVGRPWIALKLATTLDGRIADARGRSRWISGPDARDYVHWLRAGFDAIATGGRTAAQDDPSLTVRGAVTPRVVPRRVIFDRALGLSPASVVVRTAGETPTIVVSGPAAASSVRAEALRGAGVQVLGAASLDEAMTALRSAGITSMLVEGGGRLAGALLEAGLVDRYYWIQSPLLLGEGGVPAFAGLPDSALAGVPRWTVAERRALGEDTLLVVDREPCSPES
jgi:diaminohydroxyphosphoribosylaminopyrimidine deaminase/5-amino-6-(5-phosphoribosylamino)uracil reductase